MININYGRNKELLDACKPLREYSWFVSEVSEKREEYDELGKAIDAALDATPDDFEIKEFLLNNRAEVKQMCITEYDEELTLALEREEGREEGIEIGIEIGIERGREQGIEQGVEQGVERGTLLTLAGLVEDGILTLAQAAKKAKITEKEFKAKVAKLQSESLLV